VYTELIPDLTLKPNIKLSFIHLSEDIKAKLDERQNVYERLFSKEKKIHTPNPKK